MEPVTDESLRKGHKVAIYICCAMAASVFVYAGVVEFLATRNAPFHGYSPLPDAVHGKLLLVLFVTALIDFALIPYFRNRVLSADIRTGTGSISSYPPAVQRLLSASVISFALCESIAIYGLVLFLLNGDRREFYLFVFMAMVSFALHFPRYERWQVWARNIRTGVDNPAGCGENVKHGQGRS